MQWGLIPNSLKFEQNTLTANLDSFMEDPSKNEVSLPLQRANGAPNVSTYSPENYDMVASLDEVFVNRMLQLSFNRGYFTNMNVGGNKITLTEAPYLNLDSSSKSPNLAKIHVAIEDHYTPDPNDHWYNKLGIQNGDQKSAPCLRGHLRQALVDPVKQTLNFILDHIDTDTFVLDKSSTTIGFYGLVNSKVKEDLVQSNAAAQKKPTPLGAPLDLTKETNNYYGIPIKLMDIQADSTGHLNVFAELKK